MGGIVTLERPFFCQGKIEIVLLFLFVFLTGLFIYYFKLKGPVDRWYHLDCFPLNYPVSSESLAGFQQLRLFKLSSTNTEFFLFVIETRFYCGYLNNSFIAICFLLQIFE